MNIIGLARAHLKRLSALPRGGSLNVTSDLIEEFDDEFVDDDERVAIAQRYTSTLPTVKGHWVHWWHTLTTYVCKPGARCQLCKGKTRGFRLPVLCPVCGVTYCTKCYGPNKQGYYNKGCFKCAVVVERLEYFYGYVVSVLERGCYVRVNLLDFIPPEAQSVEQKHVPLDERVQHHRPMCGGANTSSEVLMPLELEPRSQVSRPAPFWDSDCGWLHVDVDQHYFLYASVHRPNNVPEVEFVIRVRDISRIACNVDDLSLYLAWSRPGGRPGCKPISVLQLTFQDPETTSQWAMYISWAWELLFRSEEILEGFFNKEKTL